MLRKLLSVCILTAAALSAQTVDGRVTNAATGDGIPGVLVGLLGLGQTAYTTTTDSSGRFRIDAVQEGSYTPYYKAAGFWGAPNSAAPTFPVKAGSTVHLDYQMYGIAKISGRVLDGAGNPVPRAMVTFRASRPGSYWVVTADANGEYHNQESMQPGTWTVMATPPASLDPPQPREAQKLGWAQTYYPGVTDVALAAPLTVSGDNEMRAIDIKLAAVPVHRISGMVMNDNGKPAANVSVLIGAGGVGAAPSLSAKTDKDGAFQLETVLEGNLRAAATATQAGVKWWALEWLRMNGKDVDNLLLHLAPPFTLPGRIVFDVPDGEPTPKTVGLVLQPGGESGSMMADGPGGGIIEGALTPHGDFTIRNLYSGPYQILAPQAAPPFYVDSIRLGSRDALERDVPIASGALPLTITYKRNGGIVRGTVADCNACTVLLIPRELAWRRDNFTHQTTCDGNGRFEIAAVRPGEYFALSVAHGDPAAQTGAYDSNWLNQAARVTVRANEATDAEVRLIRR